MTADSLVIAGRETLYEHPGTGAATELVEIVRRDKLVPLTADAALEIGERDPGPDGTPRLAVNARSKRAAVILPASSRMIDDGGVQERGAPDPARHRRDHGPGPSSTPRTGARADEAQWLRVWDAEIAGLPSHRESRFWLATGLLLPVWNRLPAENMRVRRLTSDDGISLIGRRARRRAGARRPRRLRPRRRARHDGSGSLRGSHGTRQRALPSPTAGDSRAAA